MGVRELHQCPHISDLMQSHGHKQHLLFFVDASGTFVSQSTSSPCAEHKADYANDARYCTQCTYAYRTTLSVFCGYIARWQQWSRISEHTPSRPSLAVWEHRRLLVDDLKPSDLSVPGGATRVAREKETARAIGDSRLGQRCADEELS